MKEQTTEGLLRIERDLGLALGAARGLAQAFECILDAAFQVEGVDSGGVYVLDHAKGLIDLAAHRGLSAWFIERVSRLRL